MRTALKGLDLGLTVADMRHMKYTHLVQLIYEYDDASGADVDEEREAMPSDIRWLAGL